MTGLVGMAGGIGGFYLASSLGLSKEATGSYQPGFLIFAGLALIALGGLSAIKKRWRMTWGAAVQGRSEEHTSELQSLMRISYAVFCLKKKKQQDTKDKTTLTTQ